MERTRARIWALAVLMAAGGTALAQSADRPVVDVGDQWRFRMSASGRTQAQELLWVVTGVTPTEIRATENGKLLLLTPDLNQKVSPRRTDSDLRLLRFPLKVGDAWTFVDDYALDTGTEGRASHSVVVLAFGKVRVPAGEFDAFKLESTSTFTGSSSAGPVSGRTSRTYWYAPAARAIVREEIDDPYRGKYGFELLEVKLRR